MLKIFQVDSFTTQPFAGNPAAVCLATSPQDEAWMQDLACELKHSETAFLVPEGSAYHLRWFTPTSEINLCGHATLASAHILWEFGIEPADKKLAFRTMSGMLYAQKDGSLIELDFPKIDINPRPVPEGLLEALGLKEPPLFVGLQTTIDEYVVEVASESIVRGLDPDFRALSAVDCESVLVTSRASSNYDIVSRCFAPKLGMDEDPVTGSAHCALGPFWAAKLDKPDLLAYQASKRGGILRLRMRDQRVFLAGSAVTIFQGELEIHANSPL